MAHSLITMADSIPFIRPAVPEREFANWFVRSLSYDDGGGVAIFAIPQAEDGELAEDAARRFVIPKNQIGQHQGLIALVAALPTIAATAAANEA